jgi:hypothetical protein
MNKKRIEVVFEPDGAVSIEAHRYEGADCEKATAFLERALGVILRRKRKPEYHRRVRKTHNQQRIGK